MLRNPIHRAMIMVSIIFMALCFLSCDTTHVQYLYRQYITPWTTAVETYINYHCGDQNQPFPHQLHTANDMYPN